MANIVSCSAAKITVLDVYGNVASVRADMYYWIDYRHMAKFDGH